MRSLNLLYFGWSKQTLPKCKAIIAIVPPSDNEWLILLESPEGLVVVFGKLVSEYGPRLHRHIARMLQNESDTDDVFQNTLIKIYRGLPNYRGSSKMYTWLYRIATNESLTWLDKRKRRLSRETGGELEWINQNLRAEAFFDGDEAQRKLQFAIAQLPNKQRAVFNLRYFEEMPYKEMSEMLGTSVGGLKANYSQAVKKITAQLTHG